MTDNENLIPLEEGAGILPPDMLAEAQRMLSQAIAERSWTGLRLMKLGLPNPDGSTTIKVPEDKRRHPNEVYVREMDGRGWTTAIALSSANIPYIGGLTVLVGFPPEDKTALYVYKAAYNAAAEPSTDQPGASPHSAGHSLIYLGYTGSQPGSGMGIDPILIDDRQLWNVQIVPFSSMVARLTYGWIAFEHEVKWFPGQSTIDFTTERPTTANRAKFVLVEIDRDLNVYYSYGSEFNRNMTGAYLYQYMPTPTPGRYPIGAICLVNGMTGIQWTNIWSGLALRHALGIRNNFTATTDPTNTDDYTEGYRVGSIWINTTSGAIFVCVDATNGSAEWTSGGGVEGSVFDRDTYSGSPGQIYFANDGATVALNTAAPSTWSVYGPLWHVTHPDYNDYSEVDTDGLLVTGYYYDMQRLLCFGQDSTAYDLRLFVRPVTGNVDLTVMFSFTPHLASPTTATAAFRCGLCLYDSSSGKAVIFGPDYQWSSGTLTTSLRASKMSSLTALDAHYKDFPGLPTIIGKPFFWLSLSLYNGDLAFYYGSDGIYTASLDYISGFSYLSADYAGLFISVDGISSTDGSAIMSVMSLLESV